MQFLSWDYIFSARMLINVVDIFIVSVFLYQIFKMFRNTQAFELLKGIGVILLIKATSSILRLQTTEFIVDFLIQWSVFALIVIFQPELRRALEGLGRGNLFSRNKSNQSSEEKINEIVDAVYYMSRRKIGALISLEKSSSLEEYVDTGIPINAEISSELLINIFVPNTPLHDGAVIIQDFIVSSASSYLPLSESPAIPKKYGTRHRAAIGLSEVTDAITVIVSEETGDVSITKKGLINVGLSQEELKAELVDEFVEEEEEQGFAASLFNKLKNGGGNDGEE